MTASAPSLARAARRTPSVHELRRRRVASQLFGEMIVSEDSILDFPDGLFGFASCTQWVLVTAERPGWCWLHALDHPALAFLLADPFEAADEFSVELTPHDLAVLGAQRATEVAVFAIVTLPVAEGHGMTMNLQGPVAIALPSRRGRQLVLGDARFGAKVPLTGASASRTQVLRSSDDTQA
jgi:flagellar assembly factor FliW